MKHHVSFAKRNNFIYLLELAVNKIKLTKETKFWQKPPPSFPLFRFNICSLVSQFCQHTNGFVFVYVKHHLNKGRSNIEKAKR